MSSLRRFFLHFKDGENFGTFGFWETSRVVWYFDANNKIRLTDSCGWAPEPNAEEATTKNTFCILFWPKNSCMENSKKWPYWLTLSRIFNVFCFMCFSVHQDNHSFEPASWLCQRHFSLIVLPHECVSSSSTLLSFIWKTPLASGSMLSNLEIQWFKAFLRWNFSLIREQMDF